jgi:hypothetical protein
VETVAQPAIHRTAGHFSRRRAATCHPERETRRVSDTALVILLVVCLVIAVGGFVGGIKLVRRVRTEAEATNAEHTDDPG